MRQSEKKWIHVDGVPSGVAGSVAVIHAFMRYAMSLEEYVSSANNRSIIVQ